MNKELVKVAKITVEHWKGTDAYHQAAQIIEMLLEELDKKEECATWKKYDGTAKGFHFCSNCENPALGGVETIEVLTDFCPYCGKKMIQEKDC